MRHRVMGGSSVKEHPPREGISFGQSRFAERLCFKPCGRFGRLAVFDLAGARISSVFLFLVGFMAFDLRIFAVVYIQMLSC